MSIEEIMADVKQEGTDPFADMVKDTPSESPAEKEPVKEEPTVEGDNTPKEEDIPYHKRWKEREEKLKQELEDKFSKEIEELKAFKEETTQKLSKQEPTEVPEWFKELYGENEVAWKKYAERESIREQEIEKRVIERQAQEQQQRIKQEQETVSRWAKVNDEEFSKLEAEGLKFNRDELAKVLQDYMPTGEGDTLNFRKGYEILEMLKAKDSREPERSAARKQLADTAMKSSTSTKQGKDYMTTGELRRTSWSSL
ncbi:MAG: hypothetical protein WC208_15950 [Gallionella sp.]|jgi:hypothetical protein